MRKSLITGVRYSVFLLLLCIFSGFAMGDVGGISGGIGALPEGVFVGDFDHAPPGENGVVFGASEITISSGTFMASRAPSDAFGAVFNDSNVTLSGGNFSSICFQYKTNGYCTAKVSSGAQVETGDGVWLGFNGSGSSLEMESNATLRGDAMVVGYAATASSNLLSVVENGALLDTHEIHIGGSSAGAGGIGNRIEVANGATVATTDLNIYAGNTFDLNTGGTLAVHTNFNAAMPDFNFNSGGTLEVGGELTGMSTRLDGQRTVILNGSRAVWNVREIELPASLSGNVSDLQGTSGVIITAIGPEHVSSYKGDLFVGDWDYESRLEILQGAQVLNRRGMIGANSSGNDHSVLVTGKSSLWKNDRALYLGGRYDFESNGSASYGWMPGSPGSSLTVSNGGWVVVGDMPDLPEWGSGIVVGVTDGMAEMVVANWSQVKNSGYLSIGMESNQTGSVVMKGAGTTWIQNGSVMVGEKGSGNEFVIEDGASFSSIGGILGRDAGANGNRMVVQGSNTVWDARFSVKPINSPLLPPIDPGYGIPITNFPPMIGIPENPIPPSAVITDLDALTVGQSGSNNRLEILNGATVLSGSSWIGMKAGADSNTVVVAGSGSRWKTRKLTLGGAVGFLGPYMENGMDWINGGTGNSLTVADGGVVLVGDVNTNNLPSRSVRLLACDFDLLNPCVSRDLSGIAVGDASGNPELIVANGSIVESDHLYVGLSSNETGSVSVRGERSNIHVSDLTIGHDGSNNHLLISNGALIRNSDGFIGRGRGSSGNHVDVYGSNTLWSSSWLTVGEEGDGNHLRIRDGGVVASLRGQIGFASDSNVVEVIGAALLSSDELMVGVQGDHNQLLITEGGRVETVVGSIGSWGSVATHAASNSVVVSGQGSVWKNQRGLYIGSAVVVPDWMPSGAGNSLTVSNGGWVQVGDVGSNNLPEFGSLGVVSVGGIGGAEMVVANGSRVESDRGYVGIEPSMDGSVLVTGVGSVWSNTIQLYVGYAGTGSSLWIDDGAQVVNDGGSIGYGMSASGNQVIVSGQGSLWDNTVYSLTPAFGASSPPSSDLLYSDPVVDLSNLNIGYQGSSNHLSILDGGQVKSSCSFIGYGESANGNSVVVSGVGSIWFHNSMQQASSIGGVEEQPIMRVGTLAVGYDGSNNSLKIASGALVQNGRGMIGENSTAWDNTVWVSGNGAKWQNDSDLYLGGHMPLVYFPGFSDWVDGGRGNLLYVDDEGLVTVGRDMHNRNYSTVNIETGGHVAVAGNYYQDATSILRFGVETNAVGAPLNPFVSVGGTAEFEPGATLQYHSNVGQLNFDTFYTNLIVEANQLIVGGVTNATALDLDAINLDGSLVEVMLWEADQNIYGLVGRRHLADSAGFDEGSQVAGVSRGIDELSLRGNSDAVRKINLLNGMSSTRQNAQLTQRYAQSAPIYRHQQSMRGGQKQVLAQTRAFHSAAKPEGAAGPHEAEQGLRGWMRGYGSWATHEGSSSFSGFDQNIYGTIVGLDKTFGSVLFGAAGGYSQSNLTQDNNDSSDAKTGFGVLYSSFGSVDWFGDFNVSYGRSRIGTQSGTALGGTGDFDANLYGVYLGGGKEIKLSDGRLLLTPETAVFVGYYDQEGYTDGLMNIDSHTRWNCQSRLGAALAVEQIVGSILLKPEIRAYWLHEFNADPDQLGYTLGGGRYTFGVQSPDEDVLEAGIGLRATITERVELDLDIDGQYSERYSALTVGARASVEF